MRVRVLLFAIKKKKARLSRVMSNRYRISRTGSSDAYREREARYTIQRDSSRVGVGARVHTYIRHTYSPPFPPGIALCTRREGGAKPVVETRTTRVHHVMYISRRGRIERE